MNRMKPATNWSRSLARLFLSGGTAALLIMAGFGCSSGTPAAPEGTEIPVSYEYITRNLTSGDFEAIINATVIDQVSDVPQVGVGVYFRVTGGPGAFSNEGPIRTDDDGHAESILTGRGATSTNKISIEVSSGPALAELEIDVNGGFSSTNEPPDAAFTLTPTTPRGGVDVVADLGGSTDADCPGGDPETWTVDWGDGTTPDDGRFDDTTDVTHRYPTSAVGQTYTIRLTVEDCTGLTDTATRTVTIS